MSDKKWEHQPLIIEGLRAGFRAGHLRQVLSASTGAGKSVVMLKMVQASVKKGTRVIFICERRNLVSQFSAHLDAHGVEHGIMMAETWRNNPNALVQVASMQTLERMESLPEFGIAFLDEVHALIGRKSVQAMLNTRTKLKVVGATATPFHPALAKYFTNIVSAPPMAKLVENECLVPFRVFVAHEIDTKGVKLNNKGEWAERELEKRGMAVTGDIVADYLKLSSQVFGRKTKAFCFSCGIAHGAELVTSFAAAGVNAVQLASGVDNEFRDDVMRDFNRDDTSIDILISVDMLSRGTDIPSVEHIILARPIKKSFSTLVQMVGRGARSHPEKALAIIQDHGNNWLRHMEQWTEFFHEGVKTLTSDADIAKKKEPTSKEKEAAKCPKCSAFWPGRSDTCLNCGYTRQRKSAVEEIPGEMLELTSQKSKNPQYTSAYKETWYQGALGYLRAIGKNENSAYHAYISLFGVAPAWRKISGAYTPDIAEYVNASRQNFARKQAYGRKSAR